MTSLFHLLLLVTALLRPSVHSVQETKVTRTDQIFPISESEPDDGEDEAPFRVPTSGRLPTWIRPLHYAIHLSVFLDNATYDGTVDITVQVENRTDKIVLSMIDIITRNETCTVTPLPPNTPTEGLSATSAPSAPPSISNQTYDQYLQFYIIHLDRPLEKGQQYRVFLSFRGTLNSKLVGFYLSTYKDAQGNDVRVASTQFSPTDARRAFPCFDEPSFKATFDITVERDQGVMVLSNMPLSSTSPAVGHEGRFVDRFERTVEMSTYLVGVLVSDFKSLSSDALNGTEFRVWTRKDALNQAAFSLEVGPKLLSYLEDYFGVKYPLPKLDMAAVPNFKFRGMENWGLIMYRESAMLFDPAVSSVTSKRNILDVIAHEVAHMWFGNLVTPEWWSELWLKEGFATFMGYKAIEEIDPSWKMMDYLVLSKMYSAFFLDSLTSSHPINVHVDHPDRISEIFDDISYDKGASIIRMMQHFLTEPVYKKGMQAYVQNLQYKNAVQADLWHHLSEAWRESEFFEPERTVGKVMDTWTLQDGFPVVSVTRNGSQVFLTQERFLLQSASESLAPNETNVPSSNASPTSLPVDQSSPAPNANYTDRKWWIPISFVKESAPWFNVTRPRLWMPPTDGVTFLNDSLKEDEWFILNAQMTGFFRINYDDVTWQLLLQQLLQNHTIIHNLNRVQLLDDAMNLARTGLLDYKLPLQMTKYIKSETDLIAWRIFIQNFKYIYTMAESASKKAPLDKYMLDLIIPLYNSTGFSNSSTASHETQALGQLATHWACQVGYEPCLTKARELFYLWLEPSQNNSSVVIPSNEKSTVLCKGIESSTLEVWNKTFERYLTSNAQTEKTDILIALGCTEDLAILSRFLEMALNSSSSGIIKQDASVVFSGVSRKKSGRDLAWKAVKKNWRFIIEYFGSGSSITWQLLQSTTDAFNTKESIADLESFLERERDHLGSARQTAVQKLEKARLNEDWLGRALTHILRSIEFI